MRAGLYRPVHVKTLRSQKLRMLLTHRQLLKSKAIAVENDLRDLIEPLARLVGSVPGVDPTVELQDLRLEHPELGAERDETRTRNLGHPFVTWIGDTASSSSTPLRPTGATIPNSARWARIALITAVCWRMNRWRAMEHQAALLLGRLGRHNRDGRDCRRRDVPALERESGLIVCPRVFRNTPTLDARGFAPTQ